MTLKTKLQCLWNLKWNLPVLLGNFDHLASCLQNLEQLCQVCSFSLSNFHTADWRPRESLRQTCLSCFSPSRPLAKALQTAAEMWHAWMQRSFRHLHSSHRDTLNISEETGAYQTEGFSDSSLKERDGKVTTLSWLQRLWTQGEGKVDVWRRRVFFDQSCWVGARQARIRTHSWKPSRRHDSKDIISNISFIF